MSEWNPLNLARQTSQKKRNPRERIVEQRRRRVGKVVKAVSWLSRHRPEAAARLAEFLWTIPMRSDRPQRESNWLRRGEAFEVSSGKGILRAWSWGSGPCVLLVHGWDGRGSQLGAMVSPLCDAGFRVVTFDSPGHGDSSGKRASLLSFAEAIDDVALVVGPLQGLVAHSFGAAASLYAIRTGLAVERVVFVGPVNAINGADRFASFMQLSAKSTACFKRNVHESLSETYRILSEERPLEGAPPLLIYHDRGDLFVPEKDGREISKIWGNARYVQTQGLGHHRILREATLLREVTDFLQSGGWPDRSFQPE